MVKGVKNVMVGTAGHIDHGKTALVKSLTGIDTDTLKEEKERGLSIELGCATYSLSDGTQVGIVDVPGHERFVRKMVAGSAGIDLVLLVIAADDGIMPQTREHLWVVELLGIKRGLVVLTKIDRVSEERAEAVMRETKNFLRGTFLQEAPICPVSAITGEGVDGLRKALDKAVKEVTPRPTTGVFRMPVERVFMVHGHGTVATGVPASGKVKVGDSLEILPAGLKGRARGLEVYGQPADEGLAGECVAINITGIGHQEFKRGCVVAESGYFEGSLFVEARLNLLPKVRPLRSEEMVRLHTGTRETIGRAFLLDRGKLTPGEDSLVQLRLQDPVVVGPGDRFVLRSCSPVATIGGGIIIGASGRKLKRKRQYILRRLQDKEKSLGDEKKFVECVLLHKGLFALDRTTLARETKYEKERLERVLSQLLQEGKIVSILREMKFLHISALHKLADMMISALEKFHSDEPLKIGFKKVLLQEQMEVEPEIFEMALNRLKKSGGIEESPGGLRLKGREVKLTAAEETLMEEIERIYLEAGLSTPTDEQLKGQLSASDKKVEELLQLLCQTGTLIETGDNIIFHRKTVEKAQEVVIKTLKERGEVTTGEFRDILRASRKYVVALLEYLDGLGVTLRRGSKRRLKKG
jgi:selenocysteine-specific elongation factor